ncbi:Druantia anti-phage system protein DruA [Bradyrhizobium viridifuturi]|uniref:Druantia anti-phage system protein DruA n=1 Tax=Bradyrhizobium viridifuturi TaxID=1654716 RepID=UPI000A556C01|nr:Druantia anti-phage system protein DruA [Bradyrhizobium viridifuturi]
MKNKSSVVAAFTPEAVLKRKVRAHLRKLGFDKSSDGSLCPPSSSKETVRSLHSDQRKTGLKAHRAFISNTFPRLKKYLAEGNDIDPAKLLPELELIEAETWQSELFRLASLSWSVPVSNGFGRRLRYLVWDRGNDKLMGIIAIGDPVFNLKARDDLFAWTVKDRGKRLVNILDAYVLGAVPPYNMLLGGKLVSCLVRSREVRDDFKERYGDTRGIISRKKKKAQLVVVTTSSSLGRSSVYNRLKLGKQEYFRSIGFTQGWGHFHVPDALFTELRDYLRKRKHKYVDGHGFGEGPNWRLRTIRAAFDALGFKADLLKHGIGREIFVCELAHNAGRILRGEAVRANYQGLQSVAEIGLLARDRWIIPRALRRPEFRDWTHDHFKALLAAKQRLEQAAENTVAFQPNKRTTG